MTSPKLRNLRDTIVHCISYFWINVTFDIDLCQQSHCKFNRNLTISCFNILNFSQNLKIWKTVFFSRESRPFFFSKDAQHNIRPRTSMKVSCMQVLRFPRSGDHKILSASVHRFQNERYVHDSGSNGLMIFQMHCGAL